MAHAAAEVAQKDAGAKTSPAPYLPFLTFQSAIQALEQGIPKQIDRTIWRNQSGIIQTQILMAFRFFDLVDSSDRPTEALHTLVSAENRPTEMGNLLTIAYADLLDHDLTKMTPKMLDDAMEEYGVTGETKRKAVTFFLKAAKYAGFPMHPLLSGQVRNTGPRKKKARRSEENDDIEFDAPPQQSNSGAKPKVIRLSNGGTLSLLISADPFTLPADDRKFVFELIDKLQEYESAHSSNEDAEEEGDAQ
jgi:hypothetical protein